MSQKTAELIECDGYSADGEWYSAGWGYRDTATGEVFTGEGDGDHWSDETAEQNAISDGYTIGG